MDALANLREVALPFLADRYQKADLNTRLRTGRALWSHATAAPGRWRKASTLTAAAAQRRAHLHRMALCYDLAAN